MQECTFQPDILKTKDYRELPNLLKGANAGARVSKRYFLSVQEVILIYSEERAKREKGEIEERTRYENANLTFRPKINRKSKAIVKLGDADGANKPEVYDEESILKHIERHLIAKHERDLKKQILNNRRAPKDNLYYLIRSSSASKMIPTKTTLVT